MEWPRLTSVIGERDGMKVAIETLKTLREIAAKFFDLLLIFHITHEHLSVTGELPDLLTSCVVTYCVNNLRTCIDEHPANVPGDAFAVGNSHHQNAFAGELEEVGWH